MTHLCWMVLPVVALLGSDVEEPREVPVFGVSLDTVKLDVSVAREGRLVEGLSADNFEVKDDGIEQDVELVSGDDRALQAVLVLDTSSSVAGKRLADLKSAADAFVSGLSPQDAVEVIAFSHQVYALPSDPYDHAGVRAALDTLRSGGATALRDAVFAGLLRSDTGRGRPVVLVFSDGQNSLSWLAREDVLRSAREMNAVVYGIVAGNELGSRWQIVGNREPHVDLLSRLAEATGGEVLFTAGEDLGGAFREILSAIQSRYVLRYTPRGVKGSGWHSIQVRLKGIKGDVRVRAGYRR